MHIYLVHGSSKEVTRIPVPDKCSASYLFQLLQGDYFITCNARAVGPWTTLVANATYRCHGRLNGGKGGFGSLLRAFGKQILISNNKDACRDLTGRRIRDVNNEKRLKEWLLRQAEKENERALLTKRSRRNNESNNNNNNQKHIFNDKTYMRQKEYINDRVERAVDAGFKLYLQKRLEESEGGMRRKETVNASDLLLKLSDQESDEDEEAIEVIRIDQELFDRVMKEDESLETFLLKQTNTDKLDQDSPNKYYTGFTNTHV